MRARKPFRPDTFPFLAVLLCAMGALILLLLVMDRRARAVALAKAQQALARAAEADAQTAAARRAEWERRRQQLHAALAEQDEQLQQQVEAVQGRLRNAAAGTAAEQARGQDVRRQLHEEELRLTGEQQALAALRAGSKEVEEKTGATHDELARLGKDLAALEQTLAELKAARRRDTRTYSVVPFRGKRGESRRPLYVECTAAGLIFQPSRLTLTGPDLAPDNIRAQVQRQIDRQKETLRTAAGDAAKPPYLLLLIRPDGITHYYLLLHSIEGLGLDFGYEFIDPDWVLDFPAGEDAPADQPWMTALNKEIPAAPAAPDGGPRPRPKTGLRWGPMTGAVSVAGQPGGGTGDGMNTGQTPGMGGGSRSLAVPAFGPAGVGASPGASPGAARADASRTGGGPPGPFGVPGQGGAGTAGGPAAPGQGSGSGVGTASSGAVQAQAASGPPGMSGTATTPEGAGGRVLLGFDPGSGAPGARPGGSGALGPSGGGSPVPVGVVGLPGAGGSSGGGSPSAAGDGSGPGRGGPADPSHLGGLPAGAGLAGQPSGTGLGGSADGTGSQTAGYAGAERGGSVPGGNGSGGTGDPAVSYGDHFGSGGNGPASGIPGGGAGGAGGTGTGTGSGGTPGGEPAFGVSGPGAPAGDGQPASPVGSAGSPGAGSAGAGSPPGRGSPQSPSSAASGSPSDNGPSGSAAASGEGGGSGGEPSATTERGFRSVSTLPPSLNPPGERRARPPAQPAPHLVGNRDWFILLECRQDAVVVYPSGRQFTVQQLNTEPEAGSALLQAVQQMIARRQAMTRPGEPPWRPQLRFLVRPDGVRTFYLAYPLLEPTGVPMTRHNLSADEEIR